MIRLASLAVAVALATLSAANAQGPGGYYIATPVATPAKPLVITSGIVWKWADTAFVAKQGTQRDAITCQMIAQAAGKLSGFSAAGQPFGPDALAKCNARAR